VGRTAIAVALGEAHTCALLDNRSVRCWGSGADGRLGYANTTTIGDNELPSSVGTVDLGVGRTAVAITAGADHTCAILDTGAVRCWGLGIDGQLGYGNTDTIGDTETPGSISPVDLGPGRKAVAISAGGSRTCAVLDNGAVRCWGENAFGGLGYGNTDPIGDNETPGSVSPVALGTGRTAVAITAGNGHTCALLDNGRVRCWGYPGDGRLGYGNTAVIGDNETPGSVSPVNLGAGRTAVALSAGGPDTCAVLDNGRVRCWGLNDLGQLGYGNTASIGDNEFPGSVGPVELGTGRKAVAISTGGAHTCALLDTGRLRCWGFGTVGQPGYGNTDDIGDNETPATVGPVELGGLMATKLRPAIGLTLTPKRDRGAPFRLRATGKISGFLIDSATCVGPVIVKATNGRTAAVRLPLLKRTAAGCSYSASLRVRGAGRWKVTARFAGNGSLLARTSTTRVFRAG
jgi:alpha-tubulin suppressor-like RCC1 family protein